MSKAPTKYTTNGRTYIIGDWDVDRALETLVWLTKTFGEGILQLFIHDEGLEAMDRVVSGSEISENEEGEVEITKVKMTADDRELANEFVSKIIDRLSPKEYSQYAKAMLKGVRCDGQELTKIHFTGRIKEMHEVLFQVLRHQYSDFLGGNDAEDS